jgi:hypothetical protein
MLFQKRNYEMKDEFRGLSQSMSSLVSYKILSWNEY